MAHMVLKKGRYWELQESYRDARGRPRKRFLKYLGLYSIDWRATFASDLHGVDWDAIERQELARIEAEEKARQEKLAALPVGLHTGPTDPAPVEHSHAAPAPPSEPEPSGPLESQSEQPSEPGGDVGPSSVS
jgi:hypothetical protein